MRFSLKAAMHFLCTYIVDAEPGLIHVHVSATDWWKLAILVITLEVKVHDYEVYIMSFILRSDTGTSHCGLFNWSRVNNSHV